MDFIYIVLLCLFETTTLQDTELQQDHSLFTVQCQPCLYVINPF